MKDLTINSQKSGGEHKYLPRKPRENGFYIKTNGRFTTKQTLSVSLNKGSASFIVCAGLVREFDLKKDQFVNVELNEGGFIVINFSRINKEGYIKLRVLSPNKLRFTSRIFFELVEKEYNNIKFNEKHYYRFKVRLEGLKSVRLVLLIDIK